MVKTPALYGNELVHKQLFQDLIRELGGSESILYQQWGMATRILGQY
jgi:hypothetical protein